MRTRHLVGLISGVLILSVLLPVGLSIWLAHQQVETSFIKSWIPIPPASLFGPIRWRHKGKMRCKSWKDGKALPVAKPISWKCVGYLTVIAIFRKWFISITTFPSVRLWSMKAAGYLPQPGKISKDGYRVWLTSHNDLGIIRYMVAMGTAHYVVMIDPLPLLMSFPIAHGKLMPPLLAMPITLS